MTQATPLNQIRDINGYVHDPIYGVSFTAQNQDVELTADVVTSIVVPSGPATDLIADIKVTDDTFILPDSTPVLTAPTGVVRDTKAQLILSQMSRRVKAGQTLQFLTRSAATHKYVSIAYYSDKVN